MNWSKQLVLQIMLTLMNMQHADSKVLFSFFFLLRSKKLEIPLQQYTVKEHLDAVHAAENDN